MTQRHSIDGKNGSGYRFAKEAWAAAIAVALAEAALMWDAMGAILTGNVCKAFPQADARPLTFPEIGRREGMHRTF